VRFLHQFVQTARAIEQGKLGVQMEMNKIGVRHAKKLKRGANVPQAKGDFRETNLLFAT
jgi:hypothetical protein